MGNCFSLINKELSVKLGVLRRRNKDWEETEAG